MKKSTRDYFQPTSLTWWAGMLATVLGITQMLVPDIEQLAALGRVLAVMTGGGDASPASLITVGLGLIGIRAKLERGV